MQKKDLDAVIISIPLHTSQLQPKLKMKHVNLHLSAEKQNIMTGTTTDLKLITTTYAC
jgi:hypothetical protein